jgi:hypothetical protein
MVQMLILTQSYCFERTLDLYVYDADKTHKDVLALLDTGADANFITLTQIHFLGFEYSKYTGGAYGGAGGEVVPLGEVDIYFHWAQSRTRKLHHERFLVVEALPCDLVLGNGFIKKNRVYWFDGSLLPFIWMP